MADAGTKRLTLIACVLGSAVVFVDGIRWGIGVGGGPTMLGGVISLLQVPCPERPRGAEAAIAGASASHR